MVGGRKTPPPPGPPRGRAPVAPRPPPPPAGLPGGGATPLFCDGHVQWFPLEDLVIPEKLDTAEKATRWGNIVRMWNSDHAWGVN